MEDEIIIIPDTPNLSTAHQERGQGLEEAGRSVSATSASNWLSKRKLDYLNNQLDTGTKPKENSAAGAKCNTLLKTLNVSPSKYESTLKKNPRLADRKVTDNYSEYVGFVRSSTLISPTKLSIHSKNVTNENRELNSFNSNRKRKRLVASKQSYSWPSSSDESNSDSDEFINRLKTKYINKKHVTENYLSKEDNYDAKKIPHAKYKPKPFCGTKSIQSDNHVVTDKNLNTINVGITQDLVPGIKKSKTAATSTVTSGMSEACKESPILTITPKESSFPFPTEPDSDLDSRPDSPVFNARPARRVTQERIISRKQKDNRAAAKLEHDAVMTGSAELPIDVEHVPLTPTTEKIMGIINQEQKDAEMAKKLQEELDLEFAMSLQNRDESLSVATHNTAVGFSPYFQYPHVAERSDTHTGEGSVGGGWHMHSPIHFHARHGSRQRGSRPSRNDATEELLNLVMETGAALRAGARTRDTSTHGVSRRRRRPEFNIAGPGSLIGNDYEDLMRLSEILGDAKDKGLSQADSCRLPVVTYRKNMESSECNICMAEYEEGEILKILPCFHSFHSMCIDKWISKNATCPICRVEVSLKSPTIS